MFWTYAALWFRYGEKLPTQPARCVRPPILGIALLPERRNATEFGGIPRFDYNAILI